MTDKLTTTGNSFLDSSLDFDRQVVTSTEVRLIHHKSLSDYARRKELVGIEVFLAIFPQEKSFLIVKDGQPLYESTVFEDIAVHLDMMAVAG